MSIFSFVGHSPKFSPPNNLNSLIRQCFVPPMFSAIRYCKLDTSYRDMNSWCCTCLIFHSSVYYFFIRYQWKFCYMKNKVVLELKENHKNATHTIMLYLCTINTLFSLAFSFVIFITTLHTKKSYA